MLTRLMTIAASAALLAGAAHAQTTSATGAAQTTGPSAVTDATSVSPSNPAPTAPVDTTGYNSQSAASANASAPAIAGAPAGAAVDTAVVSNGPVPDTAENRAKYGKPDSHAGKRTSPTGN